MDRNFYAHKRKTSASLRAVFSVLGAVIVAYIAGTARLQAQNCNSNSPYDQIQSSFHSTVVTRVDGTFLVWGERSDPSGTANNLSPREVTPANGYTYTGSLLDISLGSNSSNNAQFFVLTTGGLYGWGTTNIVVNTTLKNTTAFGPVAMPVGVSPTDIRKMLATRDALLLLTHSGEVWVSGRNAAIHGMGGVTPGAADNYWGRVTTSAAGNPVLSGVIDVRISPAGAFAYTATGDYYTWGPNTFLGDGSAAASRDRATLMQSPFTGTPVMIAMTTGVSGGSRQASYYSIDPSDGRVFAMGNNTNGQLGINNTTSQTGWVNIQVPGGGSPLLGVRFISGNDQDGWSTSSGAVTMITNSKYLYGLGSNQGTMIGGPVNNADYLTPIVPAGFVFGVDNPFYVETGGHTSVYVKECSDRYCYVGHRINGSMGDGTNVSQFEPVFNCTYTAASVICGASTFDAGDAPSSYDNGSSANHYYLCMDSLYLGDIPPRPNNGLPLTNVAAGADNNYGTGGDILQGLEEDGVALIPNYTGGTTYSLSAKVLNLMGATANLYAWIDWNGNGVFEASEVATQTYASMAGKQTKTLDWTGINESEVRCGRNYIRLRLTQDVLTDDPATTDIDERSFVTAYNGEIEDYNLVASIPVAAGPDIYTSILTPLPGGSVTMAAAGAGTWVAAPGNPGTAVITNAATPSATISAFSTPGPYTFVYTSGYEPLACKDTMRVFFNVKPFAQDDNVNVDEGSSVIIHVNANDTDAENALDSGSVSIVVNPVHGTVSVDPTTGAVTYTPVPGYTGADSMTYVICDLTTAPLLSLCDTAVVYITVDEINHPPLAQDDHTSIPEDSPVTVNVSGNDTDLDGNLVPGSVNVIPGGGPSNGTFSIGGGGNITYTPDPDFFGNDTITYSICDDGIPAPAYCDTAMLIITVTPVNDPPVANDDNDTTPEDTPVVIPVISNDTDVDGNIVPNSVSMVTPPANGTVTVNALTGEITYTPDADFSGTDSFVYLVCDDGTPLPSLCDTALVTINVTPVNDAPVAHNDNATTPEDTPVVINIPNNDTDVDGNLDLTSVTITNGPTNGTVTIDPVTGEVTYTPNPDYHGTDNFTYSICDTGMPVLCDTAVVTINVTPVNDPPVIDMPDVTTPEDVPVTICSPITDADAGDTFTASFCGGPYNGTSTTPVVFNGQVCVTYTPAANFNGTDSVCIVLCDQDGAYDTSVSVITITPVNDAPVAHNDNATTPEDTPVVINIPNNDTDVDGNLDVTSVTVTNGPSNGTVTIDPVTGEVTYTPNPDYHGTDNFTYSICDTGMPVLCDTAVVTINVTPVNDPPVIDMPDVTTPEDVPVTICSPITDADAGDTFTASFCGGPYNGTSTAPVVFNGQVCVTYTPSANFNGTDSVCIVLCDQDGACDTSVSVITITPVNDAPVAHNDNATTPEDTPVVINIPNNDTDVDGNLDLTSVTITNGPANGTVTIDPVTGEVTYTPNPDYHGTDNFTYSICDTGMPVLCDTAVVTINVTPVNDPPVIDMPDVTTPEDVPVTICSPITDADAGDTFTASFCGGPYNGTSTTPVVFNGQVCVTYTPSANFNGTDSVCIVLCDQDGACDTSVSVITVTPVNDPPVANDDNATTGSSTPVVINVTSNDTDIDGAIDPATVTITHGPVNGGSVTIDPVTGAITYTPGPNTCGTDHFTYQVCDNGTPLPALCDTAVVSITITDTEAPVISCPASVPAFTASADICGYQVSGTALDATALDNCGAVTLTHNYYAWANPNSLSGATFPVGTTVVTWTATDAAGNTSSCNISVTVQDQTAPSFLNCASGAVYTVSLFPDDCEGGVIWPIPVATDNCGSVTVTQTSGPAHGSLLTVGSYVITYTATDGNGNSDNCSFTINVIDTEDPTITCPGNIINATTDPGSCSWTSPAGSLTPLLVTSNCAATVSWSVQNPDGSLNTGASDISGYAFATGQSVVTYTVTETASGQNWSCSFTVDVADHEAPAISGCLADTTISTDAGQCGASFSWTAPVASDNCTISSFTSTHAPGAVFPAGTTTVTYTATDNSGNTTTCSFTVTVNDTEAPVITDCPADIVVSNDSGLCSAAVNWTAPSATDNCGSTLSVTSSHQPGDVFPVGATTVTYTFTDGAGNQQVCRFTVTVNDTEAPLSQDCPADINSCNEYISWTPPSFSDNCSSILNISSNYTPGSLFPVGSTQVVYTAVDAAGNSSTCSFYVRRSAIRLSAAGRNVQCAGAEDGIASVIVGSGIAPYSFDWNNGSSSDSVWTGLAPGTYDVTVTDAIGCSATASVTITEPEPLRLGITSVSKATCGLEDGTIYSETAGGTEPYSYLWSNGYAGPVLIAEAGDYTLTVTDANGCTDTAHADLDCDFKVPQLVSPNGDGHNDTWTIPGIELYPEAVVELYNRWGNLVYKASPYLNDFAGYSNGMATIGNQKLPAGTYFYVIILKKGEKAYQGYIELTY